MVEDRLYEIGHRIECEGHLGTLKYVGLVGNTKGKWLGIDWDDPSRGKHNGTHEGVEYFKTRFPISGSFIRPEKAKLGISCPEAIKKRYGLIDDELAGFERENMSSFQKKINVPFEVIGFSKVNKKQSNFESLKSVWLRDQLVRHAGNPGELGELCPNLESLDLSKNLFNSWKSLAEICCQLCRLVTLNVSENYLPIETILESLRDSFSTIEDLTMTRMHYNWADIEKCIAMFSALQKLSVSFNAVQIINEPSKDSNLMGLTSLSLDNNLISSWSEVLKLGCIPNLESLNLSSNKIDKIRFDTRLAEKTDLFQALKQLNITNNLISEWKSIRELEKLKNLEDLKFKENPILESVNVETSWQIIIASISKLQVFNGHKIQDQEKRGAEYDYLKEFAKQWIDCEDQPEKRKEFIADHPRFPDLIKKHGEPDLPAPEKKYEMASNVITVEFSCPNDSSQPKGIKRKLLKNMNVQKVIGLSQRLFDTGRKIPKLSFLPLGLSNQEIPLDRPLQELSYYSMEDGDHILVRW